MITTYRYVKKQIDKKKETQAAQTRDEPVPMNVLARPGEPSHTSENVESSVVSQTNASGSSSLKWKIMLMAALAMPVFLETLDYTGSSSMRQDSSDTNTLPDSRCDRTGSHRRTFDKSLTRYLILNPYSTVCFQ